MKEAFAKLPAKGLELCSPDTPRAALSIRGCREGALTHQLAVLDVLKVFDCHFEDVCFFEFRLLIKREFSS